MLLLNSKKKKKRKEMILKQKFLNMDYKIKAIKILIREKQTTSLLIAYPFTEKKSYYYLCDQSPTSFLKEKELI